MDVCLSLPGRRSLVGLAALLALMVMWFVPVGATDSRMELASVWRDRDVRVDGSDDEWRDLTVPVTGQKFAVGFVNDSDALYFCLVTKERVSTIQIERMGLNLLAGPAGGRRLLSGLHFPVAGFRDSRRTGGGAVRPEEGQATPGGGEIEILGPGKGDIRNERLDGHDGLAAALGVHGDLLVYELRVPLHAAVPGGFALNVEPGMPVGIELRTPDWRGPLPPSPGIGGSGIGIGVSPGHPRGGAWPGGYAGPAPDGSLLKPLVVVADLHLASAPH